MELDEGVTGPVARPACKNRRRGRRREVPRAIRRGAETLSGTLKTSLLDFAFSAQAAGVPLHSVDPEVVERVAAALLAECKRSSPARISAWRRALDALSPEVKGECNITGTMTKPRGKRTLSDPEGTFAVLETEMAAISAAATRPRAHRYDEHRPVKPATAEAAAKRILIMAATMRRLGKVDEDVRLADLLAPEMQAEYVECVLGRGDGQNDGEHGVLHRENGAE